MRRILGLGSKHRTTAMAARAKRRVVEIDGVTLSGPWRADLAVRFQGNIQAKDDGQMRMPLCPKAEEMSLVLPVGDPALKNSCIV